jgi:hypothetical protein
MPCTYIISTGQFLAPDGSLLGTCYAGHPPFVNDVTAVTLKDRGPLPPGFYKMGQPENSPTVGPLALPLTPLPDANGSFDWLHGRSSFFIHGDDIQHPGFGSDGCIVPTHQPDGEVNGHAVRQAIVALRGQDDVLQVLATPPDAPPPEAPPTPATPPPPAPTG